MDPEAVGGAPEEQTDDFERGTFSCTGRSVGLGSVSGVGVLYWEIAHTNRCHPTPPHPAVRGAGDEVGDVRWTGNDHLFQGVYVCVCVCEEGGMGMGVRVSCVAGRIQRSFNCWAVGNDTKAEDDTKPTDSRT